MKKTLFLLLVIFASFGLNAQDERVPVPCPGNGSPENCSCNSIFTSCSTNCQKNEHGSCNCGVFVSTCKCASDCPGSTVGSRSGVVVNETKLIEFTTYIQGEKRSSLVNEFLDKLLTIREVAGDGLLVEKLGADLNEIIGKFNLSDSEVINRYLEAIGDHRRI